MVREIISFLFSMLDCAAIMLLIMGVFRIQVKNNIVKMLIANVTYTAFSIILVKVGLHTEALLLQIPAIILIFIFMFKENKMYSIWITVTGFATFLMVQGLLIYMLLYAKVLTPDDIQPFTTMGYVVQASVFIICLIVSLFLKKMNEGFVFDFDNRFKKKKKSKPAVLYMVLAIVLSIFISMFYPQIYNSSITFAFYMTLVFAVVSFLSLIYFSIKRNQEEIGRIY